MTEYEKIKKKYDEIIRQTLEQNKQILIESFVEYYGEEHRKLIEKRYNEITFVYYIYWPGIDYAINNFITHLNNPNDYQEFITLSNSRKKSVVSRFLKRFKMSNDLPDNYVGSTSPSVIKDNSIKEALAQIFKNANASSFTYGDVHHTDRIVCFQILLFNETTIIHEINHCLTREDLAYVTENNQRESTIHKVGVNLVNADRKNSSPNIIIEELLNEKSSQEIAQIFKRRGGSLLPFCKNIPIVSYMYEKNLYLIEEFYNKFKEYIKSARITENTNALVERVGKENYEKFVELITSSYSEDVSNINQIKQKVLLQIEAIIKQMGNKAKASSDITEEQLQAYYEELRKRGYKVNILDNNNSKDETLQANTGGIKIK